MASVVFGSIFLAEKIFDALYFAVRGGTQPRAASIGPSEHRSSSQEERFEAFQRFEAAQRDQNTVAEDLERLKKTLFIIAIILAHAKEQFTGG